MIAEIIPSYLYQQYSDDTDLQALVTAYNTMAQSYLDWFNTTPLPVYTNEQISGLTTAPIPGGLDSGFPFGVGGFGSFLQNATGGTTQTGGLLDWVGQGLYGMPRPVLSQTSYTLRGGFNTQAFNTGPLGAFVRVARGVHYTVNDDIYKRCLTWNFFKADGLQFTARWLKRRVARFLQGVNGVNIGTDDTSYISVQYGYTGTAPRYVTLHQKAAARGPVGMTAFNTLPFNSMVLRAVTVPQAVQVPVLDQITVRLVRVVAHVTGGALFNRQRFGVGAAIGSLATTRTTYPAQQMAVALRDAMAAGVLNVPTQYNVTIQLQ